MGRIDQKLIDIYERFARWFQRLTGLDCFWLSKRSLEFGIILVIISQFFDYDGLYRLVSVLSIVLLLFLRILDANHAEQNCKDSDNNLMNNFRIDPGPTFARKAFLFFAVISIGTILLGLLVYRSNPHDIALFGSSFGLVNGPYFMACTPLPPGNSKASQLIKSLTAKLSPSLNPV